MPFVAGFRSSVAFSYSVGCGTAPLSANAVRRTEMRRPSTRHLLLFVGLVVAVVAVIVAARGQRYETWQAAGVGVASWSRVIRLDNTAPGFWWLSLRMRSSKLDAALPVAESAVRSHPSTPSTHYNLGVFLYFKDPERAKQEFAYALRLKPDYSYAREAMTQLEQDLREGQLPHRK